jgi:hypothetical protein
MENIAAHAAAAATSTADVAAHGALAAVDTSDATFWASKFDERSPVELAIDLGGERWLEQVKISWEFPAKAFSIAASSDGEHWADVFSTSVNAVNATSVPLSGVFAGRIRISMREAHPTYGTFLGHAVFGIKSVSVLAPRLSAVLGDCAVAGASKDARDKYFAASVPEYDAPAVQALRSELPALEAAKAALSGSLSEVAVVLPKAHACRASLSSSRNETRFLERVGTLGVVAASATGAAVAYASEKALVSAAAAVDAKVGIDSAGVRALLASARSTIVSLRAAVR